MNFSVHEAKTQFSRLLDLVEQGEEIVIVRHGKAVAQLVPSAPRTKPILGGMKHEPAWPEGWDQALTEKEADAFWEGRW